MFKSIQVSGTSGSGKTTLVRHYLESSGAVPLRFNEKNKPTVYAGLWEGKPLFFLGHYLTTSGGCDTIPSVKIVASLLQALDNDYGNGICLFEGLMISHMVGTVGAMQVELGVENHVRAFLDTPLDICLARVQGRRDARGNTKPFNPDNTIKDHPRVIAARDNCEKVDIKTFTINYENAVNSLAEIMLQVDDNGQ